MIRLVLSLILRPLEWLFTWLAERPTVEAEARLCSAEHTALIAWGDAPPRRSTNTLHIDVDLLFRKTRGGKVTVYELARAAVNGRPLKNAASDIGDVELDGGGPPVRKWLELVPPHVFASQRGPVDARAGDKVELWFRSTHSSKPFRVETRIAR